MWKRIRTSAFTTLPVAACFICSISLWAQEAPKELQPPADEHKFLQVHAMGDQIYTCKADGAQFLWTLKGPDAQLIDKDGKVFGKHFAGPTWQANDGTRVIGKAVANAPSPDTDSVPWLLLTVASRRGDGALGRATSVQRINTKGGKAPSSGCDAAHAGQDARAPYSADYVFFAPK